MVDMDDSAALKGQLLIRSIIEEYRNLLVVLSDPQLLTRRPSDVSEAAFDQNGTRRTTQEILQKLTRLFSQLKAVYNQCLDELERYGSSEAQISSGNSVVQMKQSLQDLQDLQDRNIRLKNVVDEMRQLIWDIDIMRG